MKVFATSLLLGAASASFINEQQVLKVPEQIKNVAGKAGSLLSAEELTNRIGQAKHAMDGLTAEAAQLWDEVAMMFPEQMSKANFMSQPKPAVRRQDSEWDHLISGADVQSVWIENADGEKEREISGKLDNYNMRVKKVDPAALGVDKVKQYSGYLDDEEEDKHLFYCEQHANSRHAQG
jgi:cathepsin A (carboxypeptidase C)